jgi:hypothetical protein
VSREADVFEDKINKIIQTIGDFPPSSAMYPHRFSPAALPIARPVAVPPVKSTF